MGDQEDRKAARARTDPYAHRTLVAHRRKTLNTFKTSNALNCLEEGAKRSVLFPSLPPKTTPATKTAPPWHPFQRAAVSGPREL